MVRSRKQTDRQPCGHAIPPSHPPSLPPSLPTIPGQGPHKVPKPFDGLAVDETAHPSMRRQRREGGGGRGALPPLLPPAPPSFLVLGSRVVATSVPGGHDLREGGREGGRERRNSKHVCPKERTRGRREGKREGGRRKRYLGHGDVMLVGHDVDAATQVSHTARGELRAANPEEKRREGGREGGMESE